MKAKARFDVMKDGTGWRVRDTQTGHLHSARIADKARAQRQADHFNRLLAQPIATVERREGRGR